MEIKEKVVASLLGTLSLTDEGKKISNMMYVESRAVVFFRDSTTYMIPTSGDGLDVVCDIVNALKEKREKEKANDRD